MDNTDFLTGKNDDLFRVLNSYIEVTDKYTPYTPHFLNKRVYSDIDRSNAQFCSIISIWQSVVGSNGRVVNIKENENGSDSYKLAKERLKNKVYKLLYTKHKYKDLEAKIVKFIAKEGNAIARINKNKKIIIESIFNYNVYFDKANQENRYAYLENGREVEGLSNLKHGIEVWHFKDSIHNEYPVAPSRLDNAFSFLLLENHGIKFNNHLFSNGNLGTIFLKMKKEEMNQKMFDQTVDDKGKTHLQNFFDNLKAGFTGIKNGLRLGYIEGLDSVIEVGKDNKQTGFTDLIKLITPERLAWAYSLTAPDFGSGANTTYNNANTFNFAQRDKVGRPLEIELDNWTNEWILPIVEGINTTETFYVSYVEDKDPNKLENDKFTLELVKNKLLTINEGREILGFLPNEDLEKQAQETDKQTIDVKPEDKKESDNNDFSLDFQKKNIFAKTPTQTALESEDKDKFQSKFEKALTKQFNKFLDNYKETGKVKIPKLETFYSFPALKKDLLVFAGVGFDLFKKDKRVKKFKADFDFGEYPQAVLDAIENRTEMLLKGLGDYEGVDAETTQIINSYLKDWANEGTDLIIKKLIEIIPDFTERRASLIVETEIANAIEGTRETMYKDEGFSKKSWSNSKDERVRPAHKAFEGLGKIDINKNFEASGQSEPRAGFAPRCRCTTLYYP